MSDLESLLPIGEIARRSGTAASALRFYESERLIRAARSTGGQRRFPRDTLRRIAFIRVAQRVGLTLDEIRAALGSLPQARTPTPTDWARLSRSWRPRLDAQIALLEGLRDRLDSCIGCGCLSFDVCALYNAEDAASQLGPGPRYLLGDRPADAKVEQHPVTTGSRRPRLSARPPGVRFARRPKP